MLLAGSLTQERLSGRGVRVGMVNCSFTFCMIRRLEIQTTESLVISVFCCFPWRNQHFAGPHLDVHPDVDLHA